MSGRFAVTLFLTVIGPARAENFRRAADCYAALEANDDRLLDAAWSLSDGAVQGDVEVEATVVATDETDAFRLVSGSVRTAIHEAGGYTPGWEERAPHEAVVLYVLKDEEVAVV